MNTKQKLVTNFLKMKKAIYLLGIIFIILFTTCKKDDPTTPDPSVPGTGEVFVLPNQDMTNISSYDGTTGKITLSAPGNYAVGDILTNSIITQKVPNGFLRQITSVSSDEKTLQTISCPIEEATEEGYLSVSLMLLHSDKSSHKSEPKVKLFKPEKSYEFGWDFDEYVIYDRDGNVGTTDDQVIIDGFIIFNYKIDILLEVEKWKMKHFVFKNILDEYSSLVVKSTLGTGAINENKVVATCKFSPVLLGTIGILPVWVTPSFDVILGTDGNLSVHTSTVSNEFHAEAGIKYEESKWGTISELTNQFNFEDPILNYNLNVTAFAGTDLNLLLYDVAGLSASARSYLNLNAYNKTTYWTLKGGLDILGKVKVKALSRTWVDQSKTFINFENELASGSFGVTINPPVANFTASSTNVEVGEVIQFTDLSSNNPNFWHWNFGDGSTNTNLQNPTHAYSSPGDYNITLGVANEAGEDFLSRSNYIHVSSGGGANTFTDPRDGQIYNTITIGSQTWFAENLNYDSPYSWWYDNNSANGDIYGRLYNWDAALTACPAGWHLPSDEEWKTLEMYFGMSQSEADEYGYRGTDEGEKMKSTEGWFENGNGTNTLGFNALGGGIYVNGGYFQNLTEDGHSWTSTPCGDDAYCRSLHDFSKQVRRYDTNRSVTFSVRCIKD